VATNIDYVWQNYKTGNWMIIEEKRYGHKPRRYQEEILGLLNRCCKHDLKFHGVHVLVFERTNPDDGNMSWDGRQITRSELLEILRFKE
jgi:hypothetical protein